MYGGSGQPNAFRHRRRHGFTLTELVVVMLTMAAIASIAVPEYRAASLIYQLDASAAEIAGELNTARRLARVTGQPHRVTFFPDRNYFTRPGEGPGGTSRGIGILTSPVVLKSVEFHNSDSAYTEIEFDMHSRCTTAGKPLLKAAVVVHANGQDRTVVVNPVTGEASVE